MSYYGFVVTDSGRELIAKLVAGQQLPISRLWWAAALSRMM